jgi:hypothetical protein
VCVCVCVCVCARARARGCGLGNPTAATTCYHPHSVGAMNRLRTCQDSHNHYNRPSLDLHEDILGILHTEPGRQSALQLTYVTWQPGIDGTVEVKLHLRQLCAMRGRWSQTWNRRWAAHEDSSVQMTLLSCFKTTHGLCACVVLQPCHRHPHTAARTRSAWQLFKDHSW